MLTFIEWLSDWCFCCIGRILAIQKCTFNRKYLQHVVVTKLRVKGCKIRVYHRTLIMNTKCFYFSTLLLTQKQRLLNALPHLFPFYNEQGVLRNRFEPFTECKLIRLSYIKQFNKKDCTNPQCNLNHNPNARKKSRLYRNNDRH